MCSVLEKLSERTEKEMYGVGMTFRTPSPQRKIYISTSQSRITQLSGEIAFLQAEFANTFSSLDHPRPSTWGEDQAGEDGEHAKRESFTCQDYLNFNLLLRCHAMLCCAKSIALLAVKRCQLAKKHSKYAASFKMPSAASRATTTACKIESQSYF